MTFLALTAAVEHDGDNRAEFIRVECELARVAKVLLRHADELQWPRFRELQPRDRRLPPPASRTTRSDRPGGDLGGLLALTFDPLLPQMRRVTCSDVRPSATS